MQQQRYIDILAENDSQAKVMRLQAVDVNAIESHLIQGSFEGLDSSSVILTEAIAQRLNVGIGVM